ncbi:MAG: hypothetical protein DRN96_02305 [Thermoproteota archaeon]|nr:MAG: hypothetical protein DRN99_08355 [Candidatus Korarchaeota archaeon]RLG52585.1 MAG: hypothetical protein DRN96_02305 [Candidatus Korarchaeota archaeon]
MKVSEVKRRDGGIVLLIDGERHTIPNLVVEELNKMEEVEWAGYQLTHPLESKVYLTIKVKKGAEPLETLIKALDKLISEYREVLESLKREES